MSGRYVYTVCVVKKGTSEIDFECIQPLTSDKMFAIFGDYVTACKFFRQCRGDEGPPLWKLDEGDEFRIVLAYVSWYSYTPLPPPPLPREAFYTTGVAQFCVWATVGVLAAFYTALMMGL